MPVYPVAHFKYSLLLLVLLSGFSFSSLAQNSDKSSSSKKNGSAKSSSAKQKKSSQQDDSIQAQQQALNNYNPTVDRNRMMLLDAILELNDALLAGVNASLDSLNQPLPRNTGDKRTQLLIEKRKKEQEELLPYLQHIHDSLSENSQTIIAEKKSILLRLDPSLAAKEESAEVVAVPAPVAEEQKEPEPVIPRPLEKVEKPLVAEKNPNLAPEEKFPEPVKKKEVKAEQVVARPVKKEVPVSEDSREKIVIWEPARAIIDTAALAKYEKEQFRQPVEKTVRRRADDDTITHIKSDFFLKRAQKYLAYKQYKRAYDYLNKALELWNHNYSALVALADLDAQNGTYSKAIKGYEQAMAIDNTQPTLAFKMGKVYLTQKRKNEAWKSFSRAIQMDSTFVPALMERATLASGWNKFGEAVSDYSAVLEANPNDVNAYRLRGIARLMDKNFAPAAEDFTRFLVFDQSDASVYYYRGLAKIGNKDWLEGCLDLSAAADMGYAAAKKIIKKDCE